MIQQKGINVTLWLSVVFNFMAAYLMAFPSSLSSQLVELPQNVPLLYSNLISFVIVFFGVIYAWLAMQPNLEKHLLFIGGIGKILFFLVVFLTYLFGHVSANFTALTIGDLIFGSLWLWWLYSNRFTANA
ncbi:MAG: hypothetical protein V7742_21335 [Halioglobus sp.]